MGELFRKNVRERYLDLLDWVDFRPDFNLAWCAGFAAVIGLMGYLLPSSMMIAATIFAVFAAVGIFFASIAIALLYVACEAFNEAWCSRKENRVERSEVPRVNVPIGRRATYP